MIILSRESIALKFELGLSLLIMIFFKVNYYDLKELKNFCYSSCTNLHKTMVCTAIALI